MTFAATEDTFPIVAETNSTESANTTNLFFLAISNINIILRIVYRSEQENINNKDHQEILVVLFHLYSSVQNISIPSFAILFFSGSLLNEK
jgi:hypothetical protein